MSKPEPMSPDLWALLHRCIYRPGRVEAKLDAKQARMHFQAPFMDSRTGCAYASNGYVAVRVPLSAPPPGPLPDLDETKMGQEPYWEQVVRLFRDSQPTETLPWPDTDPDNAVPCEGCSGAGCEQCFMLGVLPLNFWDTSKGKVKDRLIAPGITVPALCALFVDSLPRPLFVQVRQHPTMENHLFAFIIFPGGNAGTRCDKAEATT